MRTFTILAAAAALIGSISIANAQGSQSQNAPVGAPNPTMSTVVGKSKFCQQTTEGTLSCVYASMNACQRAIGAGSLGCVANPNIGTTGQR
jgi:hypothetical protein